MENQQIYDDGDLRIFKRNSRFYLRYDAGAHQVAIREDEISEDDAKQVMRSEADATKVLFALQKRLKKSGVKPYESNVT
jgi:hypothetical protein